MKDVKVGGEQSSMGVGEGDLDEFCNSSVSFGLGHTMSLASSGQNSRILLKRYHFLCDDRPSGTSGDGFPERSGTAEHFNKLLLTSAESALSRTKTQPGESALNRMWCSLFIPFNFRKCSAKKDRQSKALTITFPSSEPTSCAKLTLADVSTTLAKSDKEPILV